MLDSEELIDFAKLPSIFINDAEFAIKSALENYHLYNRTIVENLRDIGGNYGFRDAKNYDFLEDRNTRIRNGVDRKKYAAVLSQMRREFCHER